MLRRAPRSRVGDTGPASSDDAANAASDSPFATDSGSPATDSGAPSTDAGPETPSCVPATSPDEPDDEFKDTNCDGIDGDKAEAILVSPDGKDEATGAFGAPVKTIGRALALSAAAGKLDVYACNGTYPEQVKIESAVRIFGGYDCTSWKRGIDRADMAPADGVPVTISKVEGTVLLDRISVRAPDASKPGTSSIGILVADSKMVTLRNALVEAGTGADGSFAEGPTWPRAAQSGADGTSYTPVDCFTSTGAAFSPYSCKTQAPGGKTPTPGSSCEYLGGAGGLGGLYVVKYPGKTWTAGEAGVGVGGTSIAPLADGTAVAGPPARWARPASRPSSASARSRRRATAPPTAVAAAGSGGRGQVAPVGPAAPEAGFLATSPPSTSRAAAVARVATAAAEAMWVRRAVVARGRRSRRPGSSRPPRCSGPRPPGCSSPGCSSSSARCLRPPPRATSPPAPPPPPRRSSTRGPPPGPSATSSRPPRSSTASSPATRHRPPRASSPPWRRPPSSVRSSPSSRPPRWRASSTPGAPSRRP